MAVYIDANALQAQLERKKVGIANQRYTEGWNDCMMRVKSMVSKAPAADVAPVVHGRWEEADLVELQGTTSETMRIPNAGLRCSACAHAFDKRLLWKDNYCPNCGAKMDGAE